MDVFNLFPLTDYTFLELESGAGGNRAKTETPTSGILKFRSGMVQDGRGEAYVSASTLHMRPSEPFITALGGYLKLVGHGVRAEGDDYRIEGVKVGTDPDTGAVAFYLCTLKKESLWASSLPLE